MSRRAEAAPIRPAVMALVTVGDLLRAGLEPLAGVTLAAGAAGLDREVTWPVVARPSSPILPAVKAGELALASASLLRQLDPPADLELLLGGLAERGAAGLVVRGQLGEAETAGIRAAEGHDIPLLVVSEEASLAEIERAVSGLVRERRDTFYSRTAQLQELQFHFADAARAGREVPLDRLVQTLVAIIGAPAALTGPPPTFSLRYRASSFADGEDGRLSAVWKMLSGRALTAWKSPGNLSGARAAEPPVLALELAAGRTLLAAPVLVGERPAAALLLAVTGPPSGLDALTLARAAGICALEQARGRTGAPATGGTEQQLRSEFLADLLSHTPGLPDGALAARAHGLGIEVATAYAVGLVSVSPAGAEPPADRPGLAKAAALTPGARRFGALSLLLGGCVAILWPLAGGGKAGAWPRDAPEELVALAEEIRLRLTASGIPSAAAVGRSHLGLIGAAASRHEADGALWAAWQLFGGGQTCRYTELGIYRLLLPLREGHQAELRAFYDETLGPLAVGEIGAAGGPARARLLDTLDAFLTHGGNHRVTAEALYLHRNTLRYRLDRIADITGLDLNDPAVRFKLQVALHVRRLLNEL